MPEKRKQRISTALFQTGFKLSAGRKNAMRKTSERETEKKKKLKNKEANNHPASFQKPQTPIWEIYWTMKLQFPPPIAIVVTRNKATV